MMTVPTQQRAPLIKILQGGKSILATTTWAGPAFQSIKSNCRDSGRHQNLTPSASRHSPQVSHGDKIT
jgi:hypothetical protein